MLGAAPWTERPDDLDQDRARGQADKNPALSRSFDAFQELIILTASRCLLGDDVRGSIFKEVARLFELLDKGINPLSVFFPHAPTKAHRERDEAREQMQALFSKLVAARREEMAEAAREGREPTAHDDVLQLLIEARWVDGARSRARRPATRHAMPWPCWQARARIDSSPSPRPFLWRPIAR